MKLKIRKTDSRFTGSDKFRYYVKIAPSLNESAMEEFFKLRTWCWETWGPAREVNAPVPKDHIENKFTDDVSENWGWLNDQYRARIYLKDKNEAALFQLKWGI